MAASLELSAQQAARNLDAAVALWTGELGAAHVRADRATILRYARSTAPDARIPGAVLTPVSAKQVQRIVEIAAKFRVPIYPISRGRNWGYGDAAPVFEGHVVVDLRRMDRIIEVNDSLAYAVVEPGVTQGQLYEFLAERHPNLWMDSTGAGPDASLVGNTLDRGFGHTPVGDHCANSAALEVVLADGSLLRTGLSHYRAAHAANVYRHGVGPSLDGLFAQSNFGIVTRAAVWLMPKPQAFNAFFVSAPDEKSLPDIINRLAPLRLSGTLRSAVHVANDLRVASSRIAYPAAEVTGDGVIGDRTRRKIRTDLGIGSWNVSGGLYGTNESVAGARAELRAALKGYRLIFLDDRKLARARRALRWVFEWTPQFIGRPIRWSRKQLDLLDVVEPAYELLKGRPSNEFLRGVLWKVPRERLDSTDSLDPLDHEAGLLWISPIVPTTGTHAQAVVNLLRPIYRRHAFDLLVTLTMVTDRVMCCVTNLSFDRRDPAQCERARACYAEAMEALLSAGYPPYRAGPATFEKLRAEGSVFWDTCRAIKNTLDPNHIISPGRYVG